MATVIPTKLHTAEEYFLLPKPDKPTELVRGEIVEMNQPGFRHGKVCLRIGRIVGQFVEDNELGHVVSNDSGVITKREPDTVRGADIAFYSYQRVPKIEIPAGYPTEPPEVVFEVRSPDDRWSKIVVKVGEYLSIGVDVVVVVDPESEAAHVYFPDLPVTVLEKSDLLELPDVLPGFSVTVEDLLSD